MSQIIDWKTPNFIKKSNLVHNNKYDYSKTIFKKTSEKVIIICKEHGEFKQNPGTHLLGANCPKCAKMSVSKEEFIERANNIHSYKYDYSKVDFNYTKEKIIIICKEHGEFEQQANAHLQGRGCQKCRMIENISNNTHTTNQYVTEANKIHLYKYDYSKVEYKKATEKIIIICKEHGEFEQRACNHLLGAGCPKCCNLKTTEQYVKQATKIHSNKYDYSKVKYKHSEEKIIIICKEHGEFEQQANSHLNGYGCPKCANEKTISENEIEINNFIESLGIKTITSDRSILNGKELDIYIPEKKIAIEYDGLYWHNELNKHEKYHLQKTEECELKGIHLIHIFEDEWISKKEIIKSRLKNLLGLNEIKLYARKTLIKEVGITDVRKFLDNNHIQGFLGGKLYYGLYYENELVSLMSFGSLRKNLGQNSEDNIYELQRFCNKLNTSVIGGASKLFNHFLKINNVSKVISYADRRWSFGNLYETLNFNFVRNSVPNYFYVIGIKRHNRFNFRKDILISKYGCSETDTEHSFCLKKKWYRIYDCGSKVYEYFPDKNFEK